MVEKQLKVINRLGIHARAAAKLVNLAVNYQSDIKVLYLHREVDAKDILNVMTLGANQGSEVLIRISGLDEQEAADAIESLFLSRFGESE